MSDSQSSLNPGALLTLRAAYRALRTAILDAREWRRRQYGPPSTLAAKRAVLARNSIPGGCWVETGTFLGETTRFLARRSPRVYSLEPARALYERASRRFAGQAHVEIINGPSEEVFPRLLPTLRGPVNFWLDGHYSAGVTYQGANDTPVIEELAVIRANLATLSPVCVLVDDVRCFDPSQPEYAGYPPLDVLVDWAREAGLKWHIEHDIFVARGGPGG